MEGVCLDPDREFETFKQEIKSAVKKVDDGHGILLVTDMFGGTPSNVSLTFLENNNVEVISGVNLPMLLKLATLSSKITLDEAVKIAESAGRDNIIVASKLLQKKSQ
jgi:PTS system mannose-specific IIA component